MGACGVNNVLHSPKAIINIQQLVVKFSEIHLNIYANALDGSSVVCWLYGGAESHDSHHSL